VFLRPVRVLPDPDVHQFEKTGDFVFLPFPVIGGKTPNGDKADARIHQVFDRLKHAFGADFVPAEAGQPMLPGPTAVSIGNYRHMLRNIAVHNVINSTTL
jgi:hypothetical protein